MMSDVCESESGLGFEPPSVQEHLGVLNEDPIELQFNHSGYLFLASEASAHIMEENYAIQKWASFAN